jgi:hypothetical protein
MIQVDAIYDCIYLYQRLCNLGNIYVKWRPMLDDMESVRGNVTTGGLYYTSGCYDIGLFLKMWQIDTVGLRFADLTVIGLRFWNLTSIGLRFAEI